MWKCGQANSVFHLVGLFVVIINVNRIQIAAVFSWFFLNAGEISGGITVHSQQSFSLSYLQEP